MIGSTSRPRNRRQPGMISPTHCTMCSLDEDLWVERVEIQPGNAAVLHHALGYVEPPGSGGWYNWVDGVMIAYAPGNDGEVAAPGVARFVSKGSRIFLELHYVTTGREEVDRSRLGLHLAEERPDRVLRTTGAIDVMFEIPPGAASRCCRYPTITSTGSGPIHWRRPRRCRREAVLRSAEALTTRRRIVSTPTRPNGYGLARRQPTRCSSATSPTHTWRPPTISPIGTGAI